MFKLHSFLAPAIAVTVVACGARFSARENDGAAGAGEAGGGFASAAGGSGAELENGGSNAAGAMAAAGAASAAAGSGGRGNWGSGGWWSGAGGTGSVSQCATLRQEYQAAVEKARACDKDSTDQCSASSVAPAVGGCGCPVPINTSGEARDAAMKAYQAYTSAKCDRGGPVCDIACPGIETASCTQTVTGTFACTGDGLQK